MDRWRFMALKMSSVAGGGCEVAGDIFQAQKPWDSSSLARKGHGSFILQLGIRNIRQNCHLGLFHSYFPARIKLLLIKFQQLVPVNCLAGTPGMQSASHLFAVLCCLGPS